VDILDGGPGLRPAAFIRATEDFVAWITSGGEAPRWIFSMAAPDSGLQPASGLRSCGFY
jgi:hypothetical protein